MALLDLYSGPWTLDEAAHLGRRSGFGFLPAELTAMVGAGTPADMVAAVNALVDYQPTDPVLDSQIQNLPSSTDNNNIKNPTNVAHLQGWWIYRMVHTNQPLQEQFTLFLHDTLVSEQGKVRSGITNDVNAGNDGSDPLNQRCTTGTLPPDSNRKNGILVRMMRDQNNLFRTAGHLAYRDTLRLVTRDPAMLIYLDNRQNTKNRPQENYAREIMELFSMGVGNYSEDDVRQAAKAFTGETINSSCPLDWPYTYLWNAGNHDTGSKTVFGDTFNLPAAGADADHLIDLILAKVSVEPPHPTLTAASIFLSWKIINWFVHESIPKTHNAVYEMADFMMNHSATHGYNYDFRECIRKLLQSSFFYDSTYRYSMYKRPADYIVMALRNLEVDDNFYTSTNENNPGGAGSIARMGMTLFEPPNVAGWVHGPAWINSGNLIARFNYGNRVSKSAILTDAYCDGLLGTEVANEQDHAGLIEFFRARLIQTTLRSEEITILTDFMNSIESSAGSTALRYRRKVRGLAHLFMTLPKYQMK